MRKEENQKSRKKRKIYPIECRVPENSKDIRRASSINNAKK